MAGLKIFAERDYGRFEGFPEAEEHPFFNRPAHPLQIQRSLRSADLRSRGDFRELRFDERTLFKDVVVYQSSP